MVELQKTIISQTLGEQLKLGSDIQMWQVFLAFRSTSTSSRATARVWVAPTQSTSMQGQGLVIFGKQTERRRNGRCEEKTN